ncbi:MAG: DNA-binding protein [Candidatus Ryanbacteria bacterium RIFCSPHIGHO2_12_FULL_47_12b]|uniref:DNA-binding protein n=2 Tax=Candidatus Ryaniibacteriota TaxID=1817914 RepID=A0A1G2H2R2_9BACT|nr:MAG: Histone-like protein [Parcubacteria group bacterium GW2011_GWA2_47_10b]OGZ45404.1 MAG: DNA-binding protein [Candidatus Ryanbacteria bacterium RIFCSPHIGHO2_01_FULL_48_80]OGZ49279.1 MAG: DNA-binding protein [Candidatus Ryanbacteria bacterium RIFCSPHIGHO2_02_FULL_47_25]OGZ51977.1 MAG: DNA-binding protein [Candidatus Ryanbacteria bacterium RIFCSPLOWO2_01_FULL_47_79]OGZ52943.1 MAG: DNA-binding protein [Candidatus Ryanbacteria bacterium RIFCSPHIGHO2_12_FULL_47_12b]OGZ55250.1 MAG: DNA-binding
MNKADLIEAVFTKLGGTKKSAEEAVETVFDTITKALAKGDEVAVSGFGTFLAKKRQARTARNPRTGASVQVPAMQVPKFRAGKGLKEAVK